MATVVGSFTPTQDSVFCHLPGLSLQSAAAFGDAVSTYFSDHVLPYPQKLEFEKTYWPFVLYKKKARFCSRLYVVFANGRLTDVFWS
jgi:DNA polymerase elongation subunit (family B)